MRLVSWGRTRGTGTLRLVTIVVALTISVVAIVSLLALWFGPWPTGSFTTGQVSAYWSAWIAVGTLGLGVGAVLIAYYEAQRDRRERADRRDEKLRQDADAMVREAIKQAAHVRLTQGSYTLFEIDNESEIAWPKASLVYVFIGPSLMSPDDSAEAHELWTQAFEVPPPRGDFLIGRWNHPHPFRPKPTPKYSIDLVTDPSAKHCGRSQREQQDVKAQLKVYYARLVLTDPNGVRVIIEPENENYKNLPDWDQGKVPEPQVRYGEADLRRRRNIEEA